MARPLGAINKNTRGMIRRLKEQWGEDFDVILKMAEAQNALHNKAMTTRNQQDLKMTVDGWDKLANYLVPKLKATEIDLSNTDGTLKDVTAIRLVPMTAEQLAQEMADEPESNASDGGDTD